MSALDYSLDALEQAVKAWQQERAELREALELCVGVIKVQRDIVERGAHAKAWNMVIEIANKALIESRTPRIKSEFAPITQPQEQSCK